MEAEGLGTWPVGPSGPTVVGEGCDANDDDASDHGTPQKRDSEKRLEDVMT